jgi:gingipain R
MDTFAKGDPRMRLLIQCLLLAVVFSAYGDVVYRNPAQPEVARILQTDGESAVVEFNLTGLETLETEVDGFGSGTLFRIPTGGALLATVGAPDLPVVRRMVMVPSTGGVEVEVLDEETFSLGLYNILPYQLPPTWTGGAFPYRIDSSIYETSELYPAASAELESVNILRDLRVAWVRFNPVRVNPVTGEVLVTRSVTVRVTRNGEQGENELFRIPDGYTRSFLPSYEEVLGFDAAGRAIDGSYLFIGTEESIGLVTDLIEWKAQKGYEVHTEYLSTIGTTVSAIDAWIENAFNTWPNPPEYVMLVGGHDVVPTPQYAGSEVHAADNQYAVIGSGSVPSMHLGRICGNDTDDLAYIAWKIRMAEMDPYQPTGDSWFNKAVSMACTDFQAPQEAFYIHQLFMANALQSDFLCDALGGTHPTLALITGAINEGRTIISYIGHGDISSWVTTGFNITNIAALTNGRKMPWVYTIGCQNGEFDGPYCFCEAFLSEGSTSTPRGAVTIMGSSTYTPVGPGDSLQVHTYNGYFIQELHNLGAAYSYAKMKVYNAYGSSGNDMNHMGHIFGCPETDIYTDTSPINYLSNTHSSVMVPGPFQVTVSDNTDAPVDGALVGAYYEDTSELLDASYTNASGVANLTITSIPGTNSVTITSTCHNRVPAITYVNTVGVGEGATAIVPGFYLGAMFPNPVTSTSSTTFSVALTGEAELEVYDLTGRIVSTLHSGSIEAGSHSVALDAATIPNGLYFMRLTSESGALTRPFMVLR